MAFPGAFTDTLRPSLSLRWLFGEHESRAFGSQTCLYGFKSCTCEIELCRVKTNEELLFPRVKIDPFARGL